MKIEMVIRNKRVLKAIEKAPEKLDQELLRINLEYAEVIENTIKRNASGPPGPEVRTGRYRRSITTYLVTSSKMVFGSNAPQAWRLEKGFVGTDSLGREYHQEPRPHFLPAILYWRRAWIRSLGRTAVRTLRRF